MKKRMAWILFLVIFLGITSSAFALIQWKWVVFNKVTAALGPLSDGWVYDVIPSLDQKPYTITISVCTQDKANALASVLKPKIVNGSEEIQILVKVKGTIPAVPEKIKYPQHLQNVMKRALESNRYFRFTYLYEFVSYYLYIVFAPEVIQYFADEMNDYYGNYNETAAAVFKDLLIPKLVTNWTIWVCPSTDQVTP